MGRATSRVPRRYAPESVHVVQRWLLVLFNGERPGVLPCVYTVERTPGYG